MATSGDGLWSATLDVTGAARRSTELAQGRRAVEEVLPVRRYTNILFSPLGTHDNNLAVRNIAELVVGTSARLTLFGVIPTPSGLRQLLSRAEIEQELRDRRRSELERELSRWGHRIGCSAVETIVGTGKPAQSIIERVVNDGHDLVVVTADDDREDQATIRRLMRNCPCPVWLIRPTRARTLRVLAAVNPDPDEADLNRLILELAASMVELNGGELHVSHAWELFGEYPLPWPALVHATPAEIDELRRRLHDTRQRAVEQLLSQPSVVSAPWKVHLVKGQPEQVIPRLAATLRINLLVMGTVARTGVSGLVMGNTAEHVLDRVHCSVIAVKPPGFVSPIKPTSPG